MNPDRDRALTELSRRNPFWACLVVFLLLAADTGFRLAGSVEQRRQLDEAQLIQAQNVGRLSGIIQQLPRIEARLQALSLDLLQVGKTNAAASQIVREFNIQWTPGPEALTPPVALPPAMPALEPVATPPAPAAPATNAAVEP